ncbi:hypothetical protein BR1R5_50690 [Pseudomonas sp. BR1R-5]|uniref:BRO-N domain-containing protein n=1 Tax=Pseudomonas sp. BR1R-5 TaxID=3003626 RepID=UPI0022C5BDAD|nr:BRO family protein [Pseudomonas sp. BR1R-5]GLH35680.1 hypothetical protein BR1R5_50690 [Pseudomonas sp. BR1R-5]
MGIELDVLVGHPEHDLLFMGTQVARCAGLKNPHHAVSNWRRNLERPTGISLGAALGTYHEMIGFIPKTENGRQYSKITTMLNEGDVYKMLLAGHAPQSAPFRKWVTEEVLPTIRKTGQYNAAESSDPIAVGIMDELKLLRGELVELKEIVKALGLPVGTAKALLSTRI